MTNGMKLSAVLISLCLITCCSADQSALPSYSFAYTGTLADGGTVKMTVNVECLEENDVARIKKHIATIKRALSMTFLRQSAENLKVSGEKKTENSLNKIIKQFSGAECKRITVSEFEIREK